MSLNKGLAAGLDKRECVVIVIYSNAIQKYDTHSSMF